MEVQPCVFGQRHNERDKFVDEFGLRKFHVLRRESFVIDTELFASVALRFHETGNNRHGAESLLVFVAQRLKCRLDAAQIFQPLEFVRLDFGSGFADVAAIFFDVPADGQTVREAMRFLTQVDDDKFCVRHLLRNFFAQSRQSTFGRLSACRGVEFVQTCASWNFAASVDVPCVRHHPKVSEFFGSTAVKSPRARNFFRVGNGESRQSQQHNHRAEKKFFAQNVSHPENYSPASLTTYLNSVNRAAQENPCVERNLFNRGGELMKERIHKDVVIIGAGMAGLTAALYCGRMNLDTLVLENGIIGGQIANATDIENFPGFASVTGQQLISTLQSQAENFGAVIDEFDEIERVTLKTSPKIVETLEKIYEADAVIIASGMNRRKIPRR